jgi:hypothetical protein
MAAIIEPTGTTTVPRNNGTFNARDILIDSSSPDVLKNTLNELKIKVPHKPIVGSQYPQLILFSFDFFSAFELFF